VTGYLIRLSIVGHPGPILDDGPTLCSESLLGASVHVEVFGDAVPVAEPGVAQVTAKRLLALQGNELVNGTVMYIFFKSHNY